MDAFTEQSISAPVAKGAQAAAKAAMALPALLTDHQAAALWGIGTSKFHELRATAPAWFPAPVQLSPRVVRYARTEVEAAVAKMPRQVAPTEPASLRRARIERMKSGGTK